MLLPCGFTTYQIWQDDELSGETTRALGKAEKELTDKQCRPWTGLLMFLKCPVLKPNISPGLQRENTSLWVLRLQRMDCGKRQKHLGSVLWLLLSFRIGSHSRKTGFMSSSPALPDS